MKCGRVQLQERVKFSKNFSRPQTTERPIRIFRMCQKRLVDLSHDEDPHWHNVLQRFYCNTPVDLHTKYSNNIQSQEDLFLSVQNLQFQGDEKQRKPPRTGFKYKAVTNGNTHRMFIKQVVAIVEPSNEDSSSQLTCYYYDNYAKYLSLVDRFRPSSEKSSVFFQQVASKFKANKAVQVDLIKADAKKTHKVEYKKMISKPKNNYEGIKNIPELSTEDTKVSFHKSGKQSSLTISRISSPETVQVIRVDVVCNNSNSFSLSDYENKFRQASVSVTQGTKTENMDMLRNPHFVNKYVLTKSIKTLDESVSGGAKVTLLCKTFRLSDRSRVASNTKPPPNKINCKPKK